MVAKAGFENVCGTRGSGLADARLAPLSSVCVDARRAMVSVMGSAGVGHGRHGFAGVSNGTGLVWHVTVGACVGCGSFGREVSGMRRAGIAHEREASRRGVHRHALGRDEDGVPWGVTSARLKVGAATVDYTFSKNQSV